MSLPPHILRATQAGFPWLLLRRRSRALLVGLLFVVLANAFAQAVPWIVKRAIELLQVGRWSSEGMRTLGVYCAVVIALTVGKVATRSLSRAKLFALGRDIEFELRNTLFDRMLRAPARFFRGLRTGELMARLTHDLSAVGNVMSNGPLFL